jgi:hypothetical protein
MRAWLLCAVAVLAIAASSAHAQVASAPQVAPAPPEAAPPPTPATPQPTAPSDSPRKPNGFHFAQHDVVSFGTNEGSFTNASIGLRIEYAATPTFRVGVEVAYANLEASPDRAHSVLALLQFEARASLGEKWSVPARLALGHLASNGVVLRLASGVAFKLASRLEVVLEIAPTFFTTRDGVYPSIGPGLELGFRL